MLRKLVFYSKIGIKLLRRDVVNIEDYRIEYNKVAKTYKHWLSEMGKYTERIIKPQYAAGKEKLKILDFACGTGYITRKLVEEDIFCEVTAVDYSEGMLSQWKDVLDERVRVVHSDGIEFLRNTTEKYDIIYFGWALSYFDHKELFKLFKRVLNKGGIVSIITNSAGTLSKIEDIFLGVMCQNQNMLVKPMDIKFNLPNGKEGLIRWFRDHGFEMLEAEDGEVEFLFDKPEELLEWINKTGAAAGTTCIFKDYNIIKDKIISEIGRVKCIDGKYHINHRFVYGIFRLV